MASQKAWDKTEAAILLEALIQVKEGDVSRKDAIESVSKRLREKARLEGLEIDDIFRNVSGITFQMHSMESAYVGKTLIKPATKLFSEIVLLRKEDPIEYYKLLKGNQSVIEQQGIMEDEFFEWLSGRISASQQLELKSVYELISNFCLDRKIIKQPLLETTDLGQLTKVRDTISHNHLFKFMYKKQIGKMSVGIKHYIDYVKETASRKENEQDSSVFDNVDTLDVREESVRFEELPTEERKNAFVKWMMEQDMAERTAISYASSCGLAAQIAINYGIIEKDIWKITDIDILKNMIFALLDNSEFIEKNESRHNQFRASLVKYVQFSGDENFALGRSRRTQSDKKSSVKNQEDEAFMESYPELYMRLRSMSKVYDDPRGLHVEQIRDMLGIEIDMDELRFILQEISWITEVDENIFSFSKNARSYEKLIEFDQEAFVRVLMNRYRGGMRFDSIDLENFRDTYWDFEDEKIDMSDADLEKCLRKCGVMWQERLFPAEAIIANDVKEKLLAYIQSSFCEGKQVLYYKAIFSDLSDVFEYCFNLTDPMMLKPYLEYVCEPGEYHFFDKFISKEKNVKIDHTSEIEEFLLAAGKPLSYDEIFAGLAHISKEIISSEIRTNENIVMNFREHYFHYDLFEFSSEDADRITEYINQEIDEEGYCIWSRVFERVKAEMPLFIENNSYLSSLGIRNSIAKKLSGRFTFESEVIGKLGQSINMAAVYSLYGRHHAPFSDNDIYLFSKEVSRGATYFDALAEHTVRVSKELFVPKEQIEFDVAEIDKALSTYLSTGYMLIKDVDSFLMFPNVGYEWNIFLLESYLLHYSKEYALCNNGQSLNNVSGALVKKGGNFDEFESVCADALAKGYVELNKNAALNYLAEQNLLTRRSYAGIETTIQKAKQIRNKKG
ncbi:MAG: hypothetical protein J6K58_06365 [Lachnospiraceae bacterium]|nr:hypothetical protein [Lachnospiraceae bacterium]